MQNLQKKQVCMAKCHVCWFTVIIVNLTVSFEKVIKENFTRVIFVDLIC